MPNLFKPWVRALAVSTAATLALAAPALAQEDEGPAEETGQVSNPGPPSVSGLEVPRTVVAQKGHARFIVRMTLSEAANVTVLVSRGGDDTPVRTYTTEAPEDAGLTHLLVDAVDDEGFQLPGGRYNVRVTATDTEDEASTPLTAVMALKLTRARGQLDAFLVPTIPMFAREAGVAPYSGHVVAALQPRGSAVAAGIRRGDVITKLGGRTINTPGELQTALRELKAERPIEVTFVRKGEERTGTLSLPPDWTEAPDYQRVLNVARNRNKRSPVLAYAQAKERLEASEPGAAAALRRKWPVAWRKSAAGELVSGEIFEANEKHKQALGAFSRALKKDDGLSAARFGRGVARAGLGANDVAEQEFAASAKLDPADAAAHAFRAYVLLRAEQAEAARDAATEAVKLDKRYADSHIPLGIALLALGEQSAGVKALRTGLSLLADPGRAESLIEEHLDSSEA